MNSKNLIAELEFELISTKKLLELVPADKLDWQPHHKARSLGELALHVAIVPGRFLTFATEGNTTVQALTERVIPKSKTEILDGFKQGTETANEILTKTIDSLESKSWNLLSNNKVIFTLPVPMFVRLLIFNHLIHHRGQLSAYLRQMDILIPSIYGPSADENPFA
ncbi:MAG TPA: DinB family protein [Cyclobacteriaceae bacterium]|jgi:uncharacterized damage-inducible protein DinB|nr:DinB family protein [Cyclobacteriaceae bacterium]